MQSDCEVGICMGACWRSSRDDGGGGTYGRCCRRWIGTLFVLSMFERIVQSDRV